MRSLVQRFTKGNRRLVAVGLPTALAIGALLSGEVALAQAGSTQPGSTEGAPGTPADAQRAFDALKSLAGRWQGPVAVGDPAWAAKAGNTPLPITLRVASSGHALLHELGDPRLPEITTFYVDGNRLTLVHYCDFQNRPRLVARPSADGRTIEFDLADVAGVDAPGHVTHGVFTLLDANHHTEDWTFAEPGKPPFHAVMDLRRLP